MFHKQVQPNMAKEVKSYGQQWPEQIACKGHYIVCQTENTKFHNLHISLNKGQNMTIMSISR